jgi:putative ATP-binding cassette transporter
MIINKDFVNFIFANADGKRNKILLATLLNGLCMGVMMYSLTVGLEDYARSAAVSLRAFLLFGLALAAYYFTQDLGGKIVSAAILKGIGDLELRVMDKLRRSSYAAKTDMDAELIYAAVGGDKYGAVLAARFLIPTMSAMVVVVLTGLYLLTVSPPGAMLVAGALYAVIRIRGALDKSIGERKAKDDKAADRFTVSLKDVIEGFNELKMNRAKSEALFREKISPASKEKNTRLLDTELHRMRSIVLEQATLFLPLGLTLFLLPTFFAVEAADLVKIISVTLIVIWPAYTLVQFGPVSSAAAGMIKRFTDLEEQLDSPDLEPVLENPEDLPYAPPFRRLTCDAVEFVYPKRPGDEKAFALKIDKFHIEKGELVMMRGGNGSGKSTFMRIFAGLEKPSSGKIRVDRKDSREIGEANYRALFSIVMADFHLFDRFYGNENIDDAKLRKWVGKLGLAGKVTNTDELPTVALSSGQKKRMALLTAIMENRQIMLLDEVAADFDPIAREMFYREVLPELKAEGRTLFVISHDDRYYDIADRVVTMSEGEIH